MKIQKLGAVSLVQNAFSMKCFWCEMTLVRMLLICDISASGNLYKNIIFALNYVISADRAIEVSLLQMEH